MSKHEIDETSGVETTGHDWDGIKELDNPMPRWWLYTFYATIIFAIGYMIYYPSIPLLNASTPGISGYTNRGALKEELAAVKASQQVKIDALNAKSLDEIAADPELSRFAVAGGSSLFKVYCTQCHGSGAEGGPGYPNLNDDDWLWGGTLDNIYQSIAHGIRSADDEDTHESQMTAFGVDEILTTAQINDVTEYVLSLSDHDHDAEKAKLGAEVFKAQCVACHGPEGKGDQEIGAPNLVDEIWLRGETRQAIRNQIHNPKHGVMPAWKARLGDAAVKELALYVYSLGGGQ